VREIWLAMPEDRMAYRYANAKSVHIVQAEDELSTPFLLGWKVEVGVWLPAIAAPTGTGRPPQA
jgi:hypothetical protein